MASENIKQTLLQTIFTRHYWTASELEELLEPAHLTLEDFVPEANEHLQKIGLDLRHIISDYDDIDYYGICQAYEDQNSKECLGIKTEAVQIFYRFINQVLQETAHHESSIPIGTFLDSEPKDISQSVIQEHIETLASMGYLEIIGDRIRLGPRGLLEFRPTFVKAANSDRDNEQNEEIQTCTICLDFLLGGMKCANCNTYMHRRCYTIYSQSMESISCPVCKHVGNFIEFGM